MARVVVAGLGLVLVLTACSTDPAPTASPSSSTSASGAEELRVAEAEPTTAAPSSEAPVTERVSLQESLAAATAYGTEQGLTVGIAVLDRQTGTLTTNGDPATRQMWSASVSKLFIADNLLYRDRSGDIDLSEEDRQLLGSMLERSDDNAARTLYARYGGEAIVQEVAARHGLGAVVPTRSPGYWELTDITAVAVVRWYDDFLRTADPADRDLVLSLLDDAEPVAADGFDQTFGLPRVITGQPLGFKQGWMCCPSAEAFLHTTGLIGPDARYAVAVLTTQDPGNGYYTSTVTEIVARAFPAGTFTD